MPILKERLFGLTNSEGNHGEDVKEYYFYLDSTPTHSYMKYLYKYPQAAFPYGDLLETNRRRNREEMEYELLDTGVFEGDRYFDVFVEYAKEGPEDILVKITAINRGPDAAELPCWISGDPRRPVIRGTRASATGGFRAASGPRLWTVIWMRMSSGDVLGVFHEHVEVTILVEDAGVEQFVLDSCRLRLAVRL